MVFLRQKITDFSATNVAPRWSDYNPLTIYETETDSENLTDVSVVRVGNYYYRTIVDGNIGNNPLDYIGTKWILWDVSNRYAMVDLQSNTQTITDGTDIIVEFPRGTIDTLAIGYYTASVLRVELLDVDGTTVLWTFEETQSPNEFVEDYYSYMYSEYTVDYNRGRIVALPTFIGVTIRVTLEVEASSDSAKCGFLVADEAVSMGETLFGVNFKFQSYSVKTTDAFGIINIKKRGIQDLIDFETIIESSALAYNRRIIKSIYDDIVAFILDPAEGNDYENLVTLGTIVDTTTVLENSNKTILGWSIQETL